MNSIRSNSNAKRLALLRVWMVHQIRDKVRSSIGKLSIEGFRIRIRDVRRNDTDVGPVAVVSIWEPIFTLRIRTVFDPINLANKSACLSSIRYRERTSERLTKLVLDPVESLQNLLQNFSLSFHTALVTSITFVSPSLPTNLSLLINRWLVNGRKSGLSSSWFSPSLIS